MRGPLTLIAALLAWPAMGQTPDFPHDIPSYIEEAEAAGITHQYGGPFEHFVGGGAASFDCNGDRWPDLFIAGGENPARFYTNASATGGALNFTETDGGLGDAITGAYGAYPINIDNDAHRDLVVIRLGENLILRGLGDCKFEPANDLFAIDGGDEATTGFSAIFEEGANFPTLAFGNYIDRKADGTPFGTCEPNYLMRPAQDQPRYSNTTELSPGYCSLSVSFTDWNNEDQFDLRITNDRQYHRGGQEQMWAVRAGEKPRAFGRDDGWRKLVIWGMGIAEADLNGDGKPEYALSSMGDTMLQTLDEDAERDTPVYRDIAFDRNATAHRPYTGETLRPSTGWHTEFADFNNDARTDLFIAKGNVERMPDFAEFDPDNLLLGQFDGVFSEQGEVAGIALPRRGRGAIIEDFNMDGMLDILVVNREEPVSLFRNQGVKRDWGHARMGNFLAIELDNGEINPDAIGAKISVRTGNLTQTKTISVGGGHASGRIGFAHFGLGVAERAQVRIKWPGKGWGQPFRVFANSHVVLRPGANDPILWMPVPR